MIVHGCQHPLQIARRENICSLDVFTAGLRWAIAPPFPIRSTFWANYLTFVTHSHPKSFSLFKGTNFVNSVNQSIMGDFWQYPSR
jgi:hypothetical protein